MVCVFYVFVDKRQSYVRAHVCMRKVKMQFLSPLVAGVIQAQRFSDCYHSALPMTILLGGVHSILHEPISFYMMPAMGQGKRLH